MSYWWKLKLYFINPKRENHEIPIDDWILNIDDMSLREILPKDYLFHKLHFKHNDIVGSKCERWLKFLDEIFEQDQEKEDLISFLQEFIWYLLVADTRHEKAIILVWDWWNWKWTLLHAVQELLWWEVNVSNIDLKDINNEQYLSMLIWKLANFASDVKDGHQLDTWNVKKLISWEDLTAKEVYKKPITFKPYARLVLAVNTLPYLKNIDNSIIRRFWIIKFDKKFNDNNKDPNLKKKLEKELPWIFRWALEWLKRLNERWKFKPAKCMNDEVLNYVHNADSVHTWLNDEDYIAQNEDYRIRKTISYKKYQEYCKESWRKALGKSNFYELMKAKWYMTKKLDWYDYFHWFKSIEDDSFRHDFFTWNK